MPSVGMDAEPVLIQMWPAAIGAGDEAHRKAEHRTDHVIDRVSLVDDDSVCWQFFPNEPHASISEIQFLLRPRLRAGVSVNAAVHRTPRRIVHGRDGAPERHAAAILIYAEGLNFVGPERDFVCQAAFLCGRAALCRGIGPVGSAPVPRTSVTALLDGKHVTRHVGTSRLEGRWQVGREERGLSSGLALSHLAFCSLSHHVGTP